MSVNLCSELTVEEKNVVGRILVERRSLLNGISTLEAALTGKQQKPERYTRERALNIGRKQFNINPAKGMNFLVEHAILNYTVDSVAQFLFNTEGLSKVAIGDFLGKYNKFNMAVLDRFVELLDFSGLSFLDALRKFLKPFVLPGEGQVIGRFMQKFANQYSRNCPKTPLTQDGIFILAYSTIMLNTDLNNPLNKNKMSFDAFVKNNRGINSGSDVPRAFLSEIYASIEKEEFEYPKGENGPDLKDLFFNPEREGWLVKQGGRNKNWKKRWCIIAGNCLYYFKKKPKLREDSEVEEPPLGIVPLENLAVRRIRKGKCLFEIFNPDGETHGIKSCKTKSDGTVVEGHHLTFVLMADNDDERADWIRSLKASVSNDPCYAMFRVRRDKTNNRTSTVDLK